MIQLRPKRIALLGLLALLALAGCANRNPEPTATVYLIRHAETVARTVNPDRPLNDQGQRRARWLADYFASRRLRKIYSTPITRTQQTVAPVARSKSLEVARYDPGQLAQLAAALRQTTAPTLVAGHSNTTPELLNLMIGEQRYPQIDDAEHSLIYVLTIAAGQVRSVEIERSQSPPST